jgi:putative membrane protein
VNVSGLYPLTFITMGILVNWVVYAIAIALSAYLIPGVALDGIGTALIVAVVLGLINAIIKPILVILTLPVNFLTLGLFTFVINALLIMLTSSLVAGFRVDGFWWALLFGLVLSIVSSVLFGVVRD